MRSQTFVDQRSLNGHVAEQQLAACIVIGTLATLGFSCPRQVVNCGIVWPVTTSGAQYTLSRMHESTFRCGIHLSCYTPVSPILSNWRWNRLAHWISYSWIGDKSPE